MLNMEQLATMAADAGFTHSAPLDVATLELKEEVRAMCSANTCRAYGKRGGAFITRRRPAAGRGENEKLLR